MITTSSPTELKIARRAMGRRGQARSRKPDKGFCEDLASPAPDRLRGRQTRWPIQSEYGVRPAYGRLSLQSDGAVPQLDDEIEVNLRGETVKAQVNAITTNPSKAKGDPALEVHTEEI